MSFVSSDFFNNIAQGRYSTIASWSKIGYNPDIGVTEEDLWSAGGLYVWPTTADAQMEVLSDLATADVDIGTQLFIGTSDAGGSTTTMLKAGVDFSATAAIGDVILIEKAGTTPEWGILSAVANGSVTFANGLSSGGSCATARTYQILDVSVAKGAMAVKIDYLTSAYAQKTELVALNTTTAVPLTNNDVWRVQSFRVIAVGTKATALNAPGGNLTLRKNAGNTFSYILAGKTRARNNVYTVPSGKTLYVTEWNIAWAFSSATKNEYVRMYTRANIEPATGFNTGLLFYPYTETILGGGAESINFPVPTKLPQKTDIRVCAIASATGGAATSVLRGYLTTP